MSDRARVALVLGAGGITGGSFHAGVLTALADAGWDANDAELIVGTSAGAISGALLRAGLPVVDLYHRVVQEPLTPAGERLLGGLPPPPSPPGAGGAAVAGWRPPRFSPATVRAVMARPAAVNPLAAAAAVGPEGRTPNDYVRELFARAPDGWPAEDLWIVAVRQGDGQRVVFGSPTGPPASLGRAAAASGAVPGLYQPVEIGDHRYLDGGVHSVHNLDLVDPNRFDLVVVSAPMAAEDRRVPRRSAEIAPTVIRAQLDREVRRLGRRGPTRVVVIAPDEAERRIMGWHPMDPAKRAPVGEHVRTSIADRLRTTLAELVD